MQDDQFVWGEERTVKICEGIKDLGIVWGCSVRSDHLTEPIVKAMAEAHCKFIDLGVESFNQEILDYVKKDIDVKKNEEAIKLVKKIWDICQDQYYVRGFTVGDNGYY